MFPSLAVSPMGLTQVPNPGPADGGGLSSLTETPPARTQGAPGPKPPATERVSETKDPGTWRRRNLLGETEAQRPCHQPRSVGCGRRANHTVTVQWNYLLTSLTWTLPGQREIGPCLSPAVLPRGAPGHPVPQCSAPPGGLGWSQCPGLLPAESGLCVPG